MKTTHLALKRWLRLNINSHRHSVEAVAAHMSLSTRQIRRWMSDVSTSIPKDEEQIMQLTVLFYGGYETIQQVSEIVCLMAGIIPKRLRQALDGKESHIHRALLEMIRNNGIVLDAPDEWHGSAAEAAD